MTAPERFDNDAVLARLVALPPREREILVRSLHWSHLRDLNQRWPLWAHAGQHVRGTDWRVTLIQAGRGFGKTRAGAEWVSDVARHTPDARIALVGHTVDDVRRVMVEGESGILAVAHAGERPRWRAASSELWFDSGARAYAYSAAAPEALRGPQHHVAWCDELGKWRDGDRAWDNLLLGLRLGTDPRVLVTTTPRPSKLMRRVLAMPGLVALRGGTTDNPHLPPGFVRAMEADYGGTRLGRQELDGELLDDRDGALWSRDLIERCRTASDGVPPMVRVVVAVDPPAGGEGDGGDACGIVAAGLGEDGLIHVIEDATIAGASPARWAAAVADCARRHGADRVVAEVNQGGAMVIEVLRAADPALPLRKVHASRGKTTRAEPVALAYESGRVRHAGAFPALEDQLCGMMIAGGYAGPGRSPDRADALVWAVGDLLRPVKARARRL